MDVIRKKTIQNSLLVTLVFAITCAAVPLSLMACQESQAVEKKSPEEWVARLSDPLPANREKAESAILAYGDEALPAIKKGLQEGNLEIHDRCEILLQRIERKRKKRVAEQFLDLNTDAAELAQFKAWPLFRKFIGKDDVVRRKLFLKMCDDIPLVFENYGFKSDSSAKGFKQAARMTLVPDKHRASASILTIAYLFLADLANQKHAMDSSSTELFQMVEVLEAVNFMSKVDNASSVRNSKFRQIIDEAVTRWIATESERERIPDELKWNLIYQTLNPLLINELEDSYDSFSVSEKLKFMDIVSKVARANFKKKGNDATRWLDWLSKPMADDDKVLVSRYRKRPAKTVDVSVKMLAEALAAKIIDEESDESEKIKLEKIFGDFPLSEAGYTVLKGEKSRQMLSQRLLTRQQGGNQVE